MILFEDRGKPIVIVGTGNIAEIMGHYIGKEREIAAYTIDGAYIKESTFEGSPVVPLEEIERYYPSNKFKMFVAVGYDKLNHLRDRMYNQVVEKYDIISYISDNAIVDSTLKVNQYRTYIGKNVFIFEGNNLQYKVRIGNNVILWSCNHIGHGTTIKDHVYIASHVVISGNCNIGEYSFLGVNATVADGVSIGDNCLVGAGAYISRDTESKRVFKTKQTQDFGFETLSKNALKTFEPID